MSIELIHRWWFEDAKFCGCGNSDKVMAAVLDALRQHSEPGPDFDGGPSWEWLTANWLMAYCLDAWDLTEHGGSVGGAWLTSKGVALRDALAAADLDTVLDEGVGLGVEMSAPPEWHEGVWRS